MDEVVEGDLDEDARSQQQANSQPARLELLNIDKWDEEKTDNEDLQAASTTRLNGKLLYIIRSC